MHWNYIDSTIVQNVLFSVSKKITYADDNSRVANGNQSGENNIMNPDSNGSA